jgi:hypothetical protein
MNKCSACSNPVGPNAVKCPNCGEPTFNPNEVIYVNKHFAKKDVFAIGFIVFVAGLYLFDTTSADPNILSFLGLGMMFLLGPIVMVYSFLLDE